MCQYELNWVLIARIFNLEAKPLPKASPRGFHRYFQPTFTVTISFGYGLSMAKDVTKLDGREEG